MRSTSPSPSTAPLAGSACILSVLLFLAGPLLGGCAPLLQTILGPEYRGLAADYATSPEIQEAARMTSVTVAEGLSEGIASSIDSRELAEQLVGPVMEELADSVEGEDGERIRAALVASVEDVLDAALSADRQEDLSSLAADLSRAVASSLGAELSDSLQEDIAPQLEGILSGPISRGIAQGLDESIGPALSRTGDDVTRAVLRAAREELGGTEEISPVLQQVASDVTGATIRTVVKELDSDEEGSLGAALDRRFKQGQDLTLDLALVVLLGLLGASYFWRRLKGRTKALDLLTLAVKKCHEAGEGGDMNPLLDAIKDLSGAGGMKRAKVELDSFLASKSDRKVQKMEPDS